jgi:hypothetical protein
MTISSDETLPDGTQTMLIRDANIQYRYQIDTWFITCSTMWFPSERSTYSTPRAMKL